MRPVLRFDSDDDKRRTLPFEDEAESPFENPVAEAEDIISGGGVDFDESGLR